MLNWGRSTRFSGLKLSKKREIFYDSKEQKQEEVSFLFLFPLGVIVFIILVLLFFFLFLFLIFTILLVLPLFFLVLFVFIGITEERTEKLFCDSKEEKKEEDEKVEGEEDGIIEERHTKFCYDSKEYEEEIFYQSGEREKGKGEEEEEGGIIEETIKKCFYDSKEEEEEEEGEEEEEIINGEVVEERQITNYSSSKEEEEEEKEEDEEEEEIMNDEVVDERRIKHYKSSKEEEKEEEEEEEVEIINGEVVEERRIKHYCSSHKILLVGKGDFSFSASLANAFFSAPNIIATSLNSKAFLKKNHQRALANIKNLKNRGSKVIHGVDATQMEPQMVTENAGQKEDESSSPLLREVLISLAPSQHSLDSDTPVNNTEVAEEKTQDECLAEVLNFGEPIEKKQEASSLEVEELHCRGPIEKKKVVFLPKVVDEREERVTKGVVSEERWIKHYSSSQKILLVGEGDFSFSASLAMAFGSASNMIATSLDSREFLEENYRRAISNIKNLTRKGCRVIHEVNAKKMNDNPLLKGMTFDRVVYNFPFAGFFKTESRESQLGQHRKLVSKFLKNAKEMICETGEIHVTHKTNGFHCEWKIEQLASCHGLCLIDTTNFDCTDYAGYSPKRGFGGDENFDCKPCKTYKFGLRSVSAEKKKKKRRKRSNRGRSSPELATK